MGTFKPISGQESAPNAFEGAGSVILSPDRKFLFATNGGDNSVSSFAVGDQGRLKRIDTTARMFCEDGTGSHFVKVTELSRATRPAEPG